MRLPIAWLSVVALTLTAATGIPQARAQSGDDAVRSSVEAQCRTLGGAVLDNLAVRVDPYGSTRFGFALLSGIEKGTRNTRSAICAYDRATKQAEIGSLLDLDSARDADANFPVGEAVAAQGTPATLIYPNSVRCGQDCLAHWTAVSQADQEQLLALPEQVRRTLAVVPTQAQSTTVADVRNAARSTIAAAAGAPDPETAPDLSAVQPGARTCTLYRFGDADRSSDTGRDFRCQLEALPGGGANLTVTDRESQTFQLQLLGPGLLIVGGRTAPSGPPPGGYDLSQPLDPRNPNYGNQVGLGIARPDGRLFLTSIDEKGMEPPDPTFFQMLVVTPPRRT